MPNYYALINEENYYLIKSAFIDYKKVLRLASDEAYYYLAHESADHTEEEIKDYSDEELLNEMDWEIVKISEEFAKWLNSVEVSGVNWVLPEE